jgi:hypothetical protein
VSLSQVPGHSLPLLCGLLESRTRRLHDHLQRIHARAAGIADSAALDSLFEDIHWLVLVAGHVLTMESEGETPLIPSEITHHSIQQSAAGGVDIDTTLRLLASPGQCAYVEGVYIFC